VWLNVHRWWEKADGRSESDAVLIVCRISSEIICNCFLFVLLLSWFAIYQNFLWFISSRCVGREILNVWCYFLFSCSDEVASIMSGLMKIVYDFTCNLLSRSYVFRLYFFFFFSSGLQISILSLLLKIK
jgi:hypothetical protein